MHRFARPPVPASFEPRVAARRAFIESLFKKGKLRAAKAGVRRKKKGATAKRTAARPKEPKYFTELWKEFKAEFTVAQRDKCGFCEGDGSVWQFGEVEHFRPKAAIHQLVNDGKEVRGVSNISGRSGPQVGATGYWWLAYNWDNYLLACQICNRQWKANFFPILEEPRVADAPRFGAAETPLLLNPFDGPLPRDHLEYNDLGQVSPLNGSLYGAATIRTLGLNRTKLLEKRKDVAEVTMEHIAEIRQRRLSDDARAIRLKELWRLGRSTALFCGMVRAIIHQRGGPELTWSLLEQTFGS